MTRVQEKRASRLRPIYEMEVRKAHDVRRIRVCCLCGGTGMLGSMVVLDDGQLAHTSCTVKRYGFRFVTRLPLREREKFRLCDLNIRQCRRLMDLRGKP